MDDDVAAVAKRELGVPPTYVERLEGGLVHETYELRCDRGEYVLQFQGPEREWMEADYLGHGLDAYRLLEDSPVPVPGVVTESVREFDGRRYVVVEKLPGETAATDVSPERVRNAGRQLATIHGVESFESAGWIRFGDGDPTVEEFQEGSLDSWIRRQVRESAKKLRGGGLEEVGRAVEQWLEGVEEFPEGFDPVLCHDDFSPDNVLFRDDEVVGVVDFDFAHASHAHRDLARAANCFWMHDPCADWDVRAEFYEGYRDVRDLENSFGRIEPRYRVETLADVVAGMLDMGELSEYEREFYADRIREAIDRPASA